MKKPIYTTLIIFLTMGIFYACKKQLTIPEAISSEDSELLSAPPGTTPTISSAIDLDLQLRHFAESFAGLAQNTAVNKYGNVRFIDLVTDNIVSGDDEIKIFQVHDEMANADPTLGFKFNTTGGSSSNTSDLYDALRHCNSTYSASPAITGSWLSDFYTSFNFGAESFSILLRIPEFDVQGSYPATLVPSIPIIFVSQTVLGNEFFDGYSWDVSTSNIKIHHMDDDIMEDMIDNQTAYIVVIGVDDDNNGQHGSGLQSSSCDGGWFCGDDYCDLDCGEPANCIDCLFNGNKTLRLTKVQINEDIRTSKGGVSGVLDKYFVNWLGGKYKLAINTTVVHANNRWDELRNEDVRPKWKQKQVKRTKLRVGPNRSRGSTIMKSVYLKNDNTAQVNGTGIVLSNHFNPNKAKIFVSIYERDQFLVKKNEHFTGRSGTVANMHWRSRRMPTLCGPSKKDYDENVANNPLIWPTHSAMREVLPADWNDPAGLPTDEITIQAGNVTFVLKYE